MVMVQNTQIVKDSLLVKPRWLDGFIRQNKFGRTQDRDPPPTLSFASSERPPRRAKNETKELETKKQGAPANETNDLDA